MARNKKDFVEELLSFYDRVEDGNGVRYVERYEGAREDWMDAMKRRNQSAIGFAIKKWLQPSSRSSLPSS